MTIKQVVIFFAVLFVHISVLNLFFVSGNGAVFLWQENLQWHTVFTHFCTVLAACAILLLTFYIKNKFIKTGKSNNEKS